MTVLGDVIKYVKRKIAIRLGRQLPSIQIWLVISLTLKERALDRGCLFRASNELQEGWVSHSGNWECPLMGSLTALDSFHLGFLCSAELQGAKEYHMERT